MLTMAVTRWRRRFHSNQRTGYSCLDLPTPTLLDLQGVPLPPILSPQLTPLSTPLPNWLTEPTLSPITQEPHLPFPQGNNIIMTLHWLNEAGGGLSNKVLLEWALDVLCSPEDWRWLWSLEQATTPSPSPTLLPQLPPSSGVSNVNPPNMSTSNALNMYASSVNMPHLDILSALVPCTPTLSAENSVMWAPVVQPQLQLAHLLTLSKWVTLGGFESEPQSYDGGNVMVGDPPISFLPFTLADCTLFSHFSFNDFITTAFLDLA